MKITYLCPRCNGVLNLQDYLIFSVQTAAGDKGLLLLSPELGNYKIFYHPAMELSEGESLQFFCPICHGVLRSRKHKDLVSILMRDERQRIFKVFFSAVTGQQSTYVVEGNSMSVFGEDASLYEEYLQIMYRNHPFRNM